MYNTPETHVESDENNLLPSTRSDFQTLDSSNSDIIKHLNKYEYACNVYHRLKQFLEGIDICIAGLCLGILGAGHLWVEFMNISSNSKPDYFEKIPPPKSSQSLYYCFYGFVLLHLVVATSLLFILLLRTCFIRWEVIYKEFLSPMCIVYYSCIQMCLVISSSMTLKFAFGEKLVFAFGSVMCALQVPLMLFFFYICYKNKEFPSPIWNPPTLNIALTTLFAVHQHQLAPKWMASWSFGSSILLLLLLVPPQIFRVIAYPNEVIPSTGVSMLQAPCSIVAMVWGEFRRSDLDMPSWLGGGNKYTQDKITHFLCISATGVFWITVYVRFYREFKFISILYQVQGFVPNQFQIFEICFHNIWSMAET